jgi:hypothetical protein
MNIPTIAKKYFNKSSFVFFISINCKVSKGSLRYETILEELREKKTSQGRNFFFLKENRSDKMEKDPRNKKYDECH